MKLLCGLLILVFSSSSWAGKKHHELAKKLRNPLSNIINLPIEHSMEYGVGEGDKQGSRSITTIKPVVPVSLSKDWLLINRFIASIISQTNLPDSDGTHNGISDFLYTPFFSPAESTLTWGIGPALFLPVGTDNFLSSRKWSAGPAFALLREGESWTLGALTYQVWSFAGDHNREEVNQFFLQPVISFTFPDSLTLSAEMEDTYYDWKIKKWNWGLQTTVSKVFNIGRVPINFGLGPRFFGGNTDENPDFGFQAVLTMVFKE